MARRRSLLLFVAAVASWAVLISRMTEISQARYFVSGVHAANLSARDGRESSSKKIQECQPRADTLPLDRTSATEFTASGPTAHSQVVPTYGHGRY